MIETQENGSVVLKERPDLIDTSSRRPSHRPTIRR